MLIEVLFPEYGNLFGDLSNMRYLQACLPSAEFAQTPLTETPRFMAERPDLIYMGPMTERAQRKVTEALRPCAGRLRELVDDGVPMLFTGNACEVLGQRVDCEDGTVLNGLGILPLTARQDLFHRYNGLVLGQFQDIDIVGFKSQFTMAQGDNEDCPFVRVERGIGLGRESRCEGFLIHNLIATYLLGPLLILNPALCRWLLDTMGASDAPLAFEQATEAAYQLRLKEFRNPKVDAEF